MTKEELKEEIVALESELEELSQEACDLMATADPFDMDDVYLRVDKSRIKVAMELRAVVAGLNLAIDATRLAAFFCDTIEDEDIRRYDPAADL